ncbi:MAG: heptaprenyl diphosphate synthase [Thiobacillus sp. SCN 63-374]|nr:MAG: heptaprenyl diphosphate synthase [Thiobacillus sp. SCN 63-374]
MTHSAIELPVTADDRRIARLAALAIGLTLAEAAIPSPIPGVKPGLANIVVLLVLLQHGWRAAAWVSGLRVLAGSLLLGSLFAPGFWLSAAGALASLAVLALARHLPARAFGPVSLSVLAAWGHIGGQLALAGAWLLPGAALIKLLPVFAAAALVFGAVNGVIVARLLAAPAADGQTPPGIATGARKR